MRTSQKCSKFRQVLPIVCILFSFIATANNQFVGRKPASVVMDDDMIVVPMQVNRNIVQDFHEKHKGEFSSSKKTIARWVQQEQYAKDYGMEDAWWIERPSQEEREQFFHRNYLRFIKKDIDRTNNQTLQGWQKSWTASDEIDSINSVSRSNDYVIKAKKRLNKVKNGEEGNVNTQVVRDVKVGGQKFKIDLQLRPEIGMAKVKIKSSLAEVRAWIGANGNQEVNISRGFAKTKTHVQANYFIDEKRTIAAVDQRLSKHWSARYTHDKSFTSEGSEMFGSSTVENNTFSVGFGMGF